jgi:sugar phosphate isomerase/epimerase
LRLSLSQISTANASFDEDVAAYAAAGFEGIGVWEYKLGDDEAARAALAAAGLEVTNCIPLVPTILPNPVMEGPDDPAERIESLCASVARLAAFRPASVLCLTGPAGRFGEAEARRIVVEGLQAVAGAAAAAGVRFGLEPIHRSQQETFSFAHTIPDALELLDEAGLDDVGVLVDTFHVGDTEDVLASLERHVDRVTGLHVADHPSDGSEGRVLPGEGVTPTAELVQALAGAGWDGWLDVEIFSTPDGFWGLPPDEAARRAFAAARRLLPPAG